MILYKEGEEKTTVEAGNSKQPYKGVMLRSDFIALSTIFNFTHYQSRNIWSVWIKEPLTKLFCDASSLLIGTYIFVFHAGKGWPVSWLSNLLDHYA